MVVGGCFVARVFLACVVGRGGSVPKTLCGKAMSLVCVLVYVYELE